MKIRARRPCKSTGLESNTETFSAVFLLSFSFIIRWLDLGGQDYKGLGCASTVARSRFSWPLKQPPRGTDDRVASWGAGKGPWSCWAPSLGLAGAPQGSVRCPGFEWRGRAQPPLGPPGPLLAPCGWQQGRCGGCRDPHRGLAWGQETPVGRQRGQGQLRGCPPARRQQGCPPDPCDVGPTRCTGPQWCQ